MQGVLWIPDLATMGQHGEDVVFMRRVGGVSLIDRVIATAVRARVDSLLVICAERETCRFDIRRPSLSMRGLRDTQLLEVVHFDPSEPRDWLPLMRVLEDRFLWLPWNFVTNKHELSKVVLQTGPPAGWSRPVLLSRDTILASSHVGETPCPAEGVSVVAGSSVTEAEKFLVATSGKLTDGMYSKFNRYLCRPLVRWLTHSGITPNQVTLAGLVVAVGAAFEFAQGRYEAYVIGAFLFFFSGLLDDVDGMLARITFRESPFGTWFEGFVDNATYLLVFAGITLGLYRQRGVTELRWGVALVAGCALSVLVVALQRKASTAPDRPHEYAGKMSSLLESDSSNPVSWAVKHISCFIRKGVAIHYLLLFTVLNGLPLFLRLAAVGANLTWLLTLYFNRRFFRQAGHPQIAS